MFIDFDAAIPISEIYPEEIFRDGDKGLCPRKFMTVLFMKTRIWKQLRCLGEKSDGQLN